MWVWLESQATGLGRDPVTSAIVANDSWWKSQNRLRKDVIVFRNDPLKHIDLHHAVFGSRTVVGNHSDVAGAAQGASQGPVQWQTIDVTQLATTYRPPAPSAAPPPSADMGKGKRPAAESSGSGGVFEELPQRLHWAGTRTAYSPANGVDGEPRKGGSCS